VALRGEFSPVAVVGARVKIPRDALSWQASNYDAALLLQNHFCALRRQRFFATAQAPFIWRCAGT
jgi:hypothetical protein